METKHFDVINQNSLYIGRSRVVKFVGLELSFARSTLPTERIFSSPPLFFHP